MNDNLGKQAEAKIKEWLDRPKEGYCFDRIKDQMTGYYGSSNICDFTLYKQPYFYYIESKATWEDRFDFDRLSLNQYDGLMKKSKIPGVKSYVIILFATYQRAFILDIKTIERIYAYGKKSINIKKIDKWNFDYLEIKTIPSRKKLLDYDKVGNVL